MVLSSLDTFLHFNLFFIFILDLSSHRTIFPFASVLPKKGGDFWNLFICLVLFMEGGILTCISEYNEVFSLPHHNVVYIFKAVPGDIFE